MKISALLVLSIFLSSCATNQKSRLAATAIGVGVGGVIGAGLDLHHFSATEDGGNACLEFAQGDWLGDIIISTQFETEHLVEFGGFCGEHDNGDEALLADAAADGQAVDAGQHEIEDDEIRLGLGAAGQAIEGDLTPGDLTDGFLVGNALRGLIPAVAVAKAPGL